MKILMDYAEFEESVRPASYTARPGIYFLVRDGFIVYIGQSANVFSRCREHKDKKHDSVWIMLFPPDGYELKRLSGFTALELLEKNLIEQISPEYNRVHRYKYDWPTRPPLTVEQGRAVAMKYFSSAEYARWAEMFELPIPSKNGPKRSDPLTVKELAGRLRKHTSYVYAMRGRGFKMPGGLATIDQALEWLKQNPSPRPHREFQNN